MKRYTSLLLTAFTLVCLVVAGSAYLAGYADHSEKDKTLQAITVYTTLPAEHVALLAEEYEKANKVRVNFIPLSEKELLQKLRDKAEGDLVLADQSTLQKAAEQAMLSPYVSESSDSIAESFKDPDGMWTGVWYDPVVFCVNRDYMRSVPRIANTWTALAGTQKIRIGITDFLASDAAANLFFSMMSQYGDAATYQLLRQIHPKVVQYAKYLSTPVRMAGMGEVDLSIAVQSETLRYINDGYPLQIIYPADGTAYTLTGAGILKASRNGAAAKAFLEWLMGDDVQLVLQKNNFFFVPTNPATQAYKTFAGKNIVLFTAAQSFNSEERHALLDRWVKNIRLK